MIKEVMIEDPETSDLLMTFIDLDWKRDRYHEELVEGLG